ncbi:3-hydroxyacyl-[acyl-carrier-protein] dehydratase FabZ [Sesamum alatum]|uniref:3-hydroxyacyl-[acyl-carrier-protein] dehydratase n=1 Tax=Sesamum alatum TaxID=300844 RepID=A0AAE1YY86_9LAMI|nr:3-hydroxyacyl-[acyl-carrier-protein] dehydratase FabZ [Sesamum alatum]
MASAVLSQSVFSSLTSSPSTNAKKSVDGALPFSVSFKQPRLISRSHVVSTHLKKAQKSFIANCAPSADSSAEIPIELKYPAFPTVMDINQIREILPHRFPFLLVDRVVEYTPGVSAVAIKNVTINDNFFPGHFPERPIMPGVLMVEAMAQVGGLVMLQPEVGGSRDNFFFAGIDKVRFRKPVIAGDTLVMRMNLVKLQKRFGIAKMEGKAYVGGEVVCEGEFLMAMGSE